MKQWGVYTDYGYTPNPELKGWSNDHPFPPEIEVESPYLKRPAGAAANGASAVCSQAPPTSARGDASASVRRPGSRTCAELVRTSPDRLEDAARRGRAGEAELQADGSVLLADPADKAIEWQAGRRLDVPAEARAGLAGQRSASSCCRTRLTAARSPATAPTPPSVALGVDPLDRVRQGSARWRSSTPRPTCKEPRYSKRHEILGILRRLADLEAAQRQDRRRRSGARQAASSWPTDDELVVVKTDQAGCIRLSVSPFGLDPGGTARRSTTTQLQGALAKPDRADARAGRGARPSFTCSAPAATRRPGPRPSRSDRELLRVPATARPTRW